MYLLDPPSLLHAKTILGLHGSPVCGHCVEVFHQHHRMKLWCTGRATEYLVIYVSK